MAKHQHGSRSHHSSRSHRYELIELAALFGTAAVADLLSDVLGHRSEGPGVLACLSVLLIVVLFAHRVWRRRATSPPGQGGPGTQEDAETGTLWRIRTGVEDTPGRLAVLAGALAASGANILTMQVHPTGSGATDEFLVRTSPGVTAAKLTAALTAAGGGEPWVGRADIHALADAPAQALVLARKLLARPGPGTDEGETVGDQLLLVLAELLGAESVEWSADPAGRAPTAEGIDGIDRTTLRLRVHDSAKQGALPGFLLVTRPGLPFTPAEYARARAMADLAALAGSPGPLLPTASQDAASQDATAGSTAPVDCAGISPSSSSVSEASVAPRV